MKETASQLKSPSYVMNFPFTLDTKNPNNIWMTELSEEKLKINKNKAYRQFFDLYNFLAGSGLVYLIPNYMDGYPGFQDQVYTANVGIYLPSVTDKNIIVASNFTSDPRKGEENLAMPLFEAMGYTTIKSPHKFEGEADLKYLYDNIYIGGYGQRTEKATHLWMNNEFATNIIPVEMVDPYLYHLDCSVFPLNKNKTLMCTELFEPSELEAISKHTEIVDIDLDAAYSGICNSVRLGNTILCASNISELSRKSEDYEYEKHKINTLEAICSNEGMEPVLFNLSEYMKSGAMLSCMVMHLNYEESTPLV
jgi:N-dimethylarginine dimethylaminohydrolase